MNALLNKFTKVTLKTTTLIPSEDKAALDLLHFQYETAMEQLDEWRMFFEQEVKKADTKYFTLGTKKNWDDVESLSVNKHPDSSTDPFDYHMFFAGYQVIECVNKMAECRTRYISETYKYFAGKYSLDIASNKEVLITLPKLSYMEVVDDIRKQFGGLNFNAIAKDRVVTRFRAEAGYQERLKLSGRSLELIDYMNFDSGYRCNQYNKCLQVLEDAVMFFERGHVQKGAMFKSESFFDFSINFTQDYSFMNCEKLEAIRLFQNRKITLKFKTPAIATAFYEYFDFNTLKASRW